MHPHDFNASYARHLLTVKLVLTQLTVSHVSLMRFLLPQIIPAKNALVVLEWDVKIVI